MYYPEICSRDWGKPRNPLFRMVYVPVEILTDQVSRVEPARHGNWITRNCRKAIVLFQSQKQETIPILQKYFMGPRSPLACKKDLATKAHQKTVKPNSDKHIQPFWRSILILPSHLRTGFLRGPFTSRFLYICSPSGAYCMSWFSHSNDILWRLYM
jgi:hypothetical protein